MPLHSIQTNKNGSNINNATTGITSYSMLNKNTIADTSVVLSDRNNAKSQMDSTKRKGTVIIVTEGAEEDTFIEKNGEDDNNADISNDFTSSSAARSKKPFVYYEGVDCKKALYIFSKRNIFRRLCFKIYKHQSFEKCVFSYV